MGARNRPFFRVVVADSRSPNSGRVIESIGYYDPMRAMGDCVMKLDRLEYWQGNGAIATGNVKALIKRAIPYEKTLKPALAAPDDEPARVVGDGADRWFGLGRSGVARAATGITRRDIIRYQQISRRPRARSGIYQGIGTAIRLR